MKRIVIVTGTSAEWGLLKNLVKKLSEEIEFDVYIVATGSHLSPNHGMSIKDVKNDLNGIQKETPEHFVSIIPTEIVMANDSPTAISKSLGLAVISFGEIYERIQPDLIILLGDRYEIAAAACSANLFNIPVAHIHGGETTSGSYDNVFRDMISVASQLHFPATEKYETNLIIKGIPQENIFNVGALGYSGLYKRKNWTYSRTIIVLVHPETNNLTYFKKWWKSLLYYITSDYTIPRDSYGGRAIFVEPNYDVGSYKLLEGTGFIAHRYSRDDFINLLRGADALVGNSSSGIIECPMLGVPSINVGKRQEGRQMAESIIQCDGSLEDIRKAFKKLYSEEFSTLIETDYKLYYVGENVEDKITEKIKSFIINKRSI